MTTTNWIEVIAAVHVLAVLIVNLTPTPKDNEFLRKWYPWIERLAGILTDLAKQSSSPPEDKQ
jgi:hypothetical protein